MTSEGQHSGQPAEATSGDGFPPGTDERRTPGRASVPADGFPHSYGPPPQATPNGGSPFVVPAVPPFGQATPGAPDDRFGPPTSPPPAGPPTGSARVPQGTARVPVFPPSADAPRSASGPGGFAGFPGGSAGDPAGSASGSGGFPGGSGGFPPGPAIPSGDAAVPSAWAPPPSASADSSSEDNPFDSHPYRGGGVSGGPLTDQRSDFTGFAPGSPARGRVEPESATPGPMWGAAFDPAAEPRSSSGVPFGLESGSSAPGYRAPDPESDESDPSGGRPPGLSAFGDQRVRVPGATLTGIPDALGFPPRPPAGGAEIVDRSAEGNALPRRVASDDPTGFGAQARSGNSATLPRPTDPDASGRRLTTDLPIRGARPGFGGGAGGGESMFGFTPSQGRASGTGPAETAPPTDAAAAAGRTFGDTPFGGPSSQANDAPFGSQPPLGTAPSRGNQPLFGEQPGWGESRDRGDQPFSGPPAARPEGFGGTPFGSPSPAENPGTARQELPEADPSPFGNAPATRQDPFGRAEPPASQQDPYGRAEPSSGSPATQQDPFGNAEPFSEPTTTFRAEQHPGTPSAFSGSPTTRQDPFGNAELPVIEQDPYGRAEPSSGSPAVWREPPVSGSSAFGGSPAAAPSSPPYAAGGPGQSSLAQNSQELSGLGRGQGPEGRRSTAYGSPVQPSAESGEDLRRSPFDSGADPSPYGSPTTAAHNAGNDSVSYDAPGDDGTGQSPYAAGNDGSGHSPFTPGPYAPGNDGAGQPPFSPGNGAYTPDNDGAGQPPFARDNRAYTPDNDGIGQPPFAPGSGAGQPPFARDNDGIGQPPFAPGSGAGQPLYGRGNDVPDESPYGRGRSGNDDLYGRPQPDGFAAGMPYDRRPESDEDDSGAHGNPVSGGFPQRTPGASLGSVGVAPESPAGVPAPRDPADAGGPAKGTARPVSASASVPVASRVEGEELPPPAKAPQSRVYGRAIQPAEDVDDSPSSAPVSPFARPGSERHSADPVGGISQDLPPLGPKTPPPGGNPVPARATASARVVPPPPPGHDGPGHAPTGGPTPDNYGEDTTDMVGRRQPAGQPYVPAPALPSMHARPPLVDGFPPVPGAEDAGPRQSGPSSERPRLGGVFPGPGGAEPGSQSRATVTPPPGPDETSSWPGPAADSEQSRFEQFKPDTETPSKPENTHVRRLPLVLLVVLGAVLVVGIPIGAVWLIGRGSDSGFSANVGDCVKPSGSAAVKANCGDPGTFSVVSKVDSKDKCPDPEQPYVDNTGDGKAQILCLKPSS